MHDAANNPSHGSIVLSAKWVYLEADLIIISNLFL